jgi:type II secretion system protein N
MADLRQYLTLEYWREHSLMAAYVAWGVILFLVFTVGNFPYQDTLSAIVMPLGCKLAYDDQRSSFPIGAVLENVRLISQDSTGGMLFQSADMTLAPALGSMLIGRPGLHINAEAYDGRILATVWRIRDGIAIDFDARTLNLARYKMAAQYGVRLIGTLSGAGSLALSQQSLNGSTGHFGFTGKAITLRLGGTFAPITLTDCSGTFRLDNGKLKIEQLDGKGPDLTLHVNGEATLGPDIADSTLQATLELNPTPMGRARLGILLGLLPRPPDSRPYQIRGPLLSPTIS